MIANQYSTSINLIRDLDRPVNYIPTPNAIRVFDQLASDFNMGIHAFNIIGSYGTGKSAFLLAVEKTLRGESDAFSPLNGHFGGIRDFEFINIVGEHGSLANSLTKGLCCAPTSSPLQALKNVYADIIERKALLLLVIDEFGKFLEFAARNNPEKELFLIQQLAEYAADKNILLVTTLHQSFDSYAFGLHHTQKQEWEKVKGRLKEIPFNEPVEQLLHLAASRMEGKNDASVPPSLDNVIKVIERSATFSLRAEITLSLATKLLPLDLLSASVLTEALQRYGQNERSLFTFLESNDYFGVNDLDHIKAPYYNLANVYDYLLHNYYTVLSTRYNPDYIQWSALRRSVERVDGAVDNGRVVAFKLVKTVGLLNIFAPAAGKINAEFLRDYGRDCLGISGVDDVLARLESLKIIRYVAFKERYILFEGTDLNIEHALEQASASIGPVTDILSALKKYFHFPLLPAKAATYKYGTPRFFEFVLSHKPILRKPENEIDGFINLLFSEELTEQDVCRFSSEVSDAVLFVLYKNTGQLRRHIEEIAKVEVVLSTVTDDRVAVRELKELRGHHIEQLNQEVLGKLYSQSNDVVHICNGRALEKTLNLNAVLSEICETTYNLTPVFRNELVNRQKLSSAVTVARKALLTAIVNRWQEEDLGFPKDKFPPEKAIYYSLLKQTQVHCQHDSGHFFSAPEDTTFQPLWNFCTEFLQSARTTKKSIQDLWDNLASKPFKLKKGFLEFWIPVFLFTQRDEFALFGEQGYIPYLTPEVLELIIKKPGKFQVKTFDISGVRLHLFNKYRQLLDQRCESKPSNQSFIETIKPFLTFYRELPEYAKKTGRLCKTTLALREAIADATDPERTFFEAFPQALGYSMIDLSTDSEVLGEYVAQLETAILELRTCFEELVNRVEAQLLKEIGLSGQGFPNYRNQMVERYKAIKQHFLLPYQKKFFVRLQSILPARNAWINSLTHAVLGKGLDTLRDEEEPLLFDKLSQILVEMDGLCDLSEIEFDPDKESVLKLELTSPGKEHIGYLLRLPKEIEPTSKKLEQEIVTRLTDDHKLNISVLTKLLKQQLSDDQS